MLILGQISGGGCTGRPCTFRHENCKNMFLTVETIMPVECDIFGDGITVWEFTSECIDTGALVETVQFVADPVFVGFRETIFFDGFS